MIHFPNKLERSYLRKMGLPWALILFVDKDELEPVITHARDQHKAHETDEQVKARALARYCFDRRKSHLVAVVLIILLVLLLAVRSNAQTAGPTPRTGTGGGGGGQQYTDGTTQATPTGTVALGKNASNVVHSLFLDNSGNLFVNCVSGCAGGTSTPTDTFANPTTAGISQSFNMVWNGTSWDRLKGDVTNGVYVNIKAATTVPVSGPLTDTQLRATAVPVSGTFFQGTQPVSGPLTDTQLRATAVPVSGTFFQGTQPVSIAATLAMKPDGTLWSLTGTSANVNVTNFPATQPVSGAFFQSTQPVSVAATLAVKPDGTVWTLTGTSANANITNFPATQAVSGTTTANQGTANSLANAWPVKVTDGTNTLPTGDAVARAIFHKVTDGTNTQAVKAASTVAAATDPAAVVSQSPNGGNPCINPSATVVSTSVATSGTTAVQVIAASGTTKVYLCSIYVVGVSGTTPTWGLVYGTGTNCATGQTTIFTAISTVANSILQFQEGPVFITPASQAVCYLDGGTTPVQRLVINSVQQ